MAGYWTGVLPWRQAFSSRSPFSLSLSIGINSLHSRTFSSGIQDQASTATNSTITKVSDPPNEAPLPLPRSLSPSKGLFLISVPVAPHHWPSHLDLYSTLYRRSAKLLKPAGLAVNCVYDGHSSATSFDVDTKEVYPTRLFRGRGLGVIEYPTFSEGIIDQVKADLNGMTNTDTTTIPAVSIQRGSSALDSSVQGNQLEVLVCTHGSRDCRCSERGGALVSALKKEIQRRGLEHRIRVSEVAHVGGHK